MRKPTREFPPSTARKPELGMVRQVRRYELITPLFGGGVVPGQPDPVTVVRGSEIRGHLRFWWRATRGAYGRAEELRAAEGGLWGAASESGGSGPSRVSVQTQAISGGKPFVVTDRHGHKVAISHWSSDYSYAAFSAGDTADVREGVVFDLTIEFPAEEQADVEAALWAWETFGGLGARTRRGFGALRLVSLDGGAVTPPAADQVEQQIRNGLRRHVKNGSWPKDVPHLTSNLTFVVTKGYPDALEAWKALLRAIKSFRQQRNPGSNRPGRSKWPEPDAIRRLTGQRAGRHSTPLSNLNKFPRAAFGLPIVFQFIDRKQGDPDTTTLQGVEADRLASPLLLRPLACQQGRAVGLAGVLEGPQEPPGGLMLKGGRGAPRVTRQVTGPEAAVIAPLGGNPDVLEAFLQYLRSNYS